MLLSMYVECNCEGESVDVIDTTIKCDGNCDYTGETDLKVMKLTCNNSLEIDYIQIECNASYQEGLSCEVYIDQASQANSPNCENTNDCEPYYGNTQISTVEDISDSNYISSTTVSEANADACYSASVVVVLGVLVGLFAVLLTVTTIGWVWTCLVSRKRGRMNISSKTIR